MPFLNCISTQLDESNTFYRAFQEITFNLVQDHMLFYFAKWTGKTIKLTFEA